MSQFAKRPKRKPAEKTNAVAKAWQNIQRGNSTIEDFETVFVDLCDYFGYYRRPTYADWISGTKTPQGFELHSALSNARAEVIQYMMGFLTLDETAMVNLERAARQEAQR